MLSNGERQQVNVGLVQINNSFSNQNYLPLSVGMLQAYVQKHSSHPEHYQFLLPLYSRISVEEAVHSLFEADVVFFSMYVWNAKISLEIAQRLKCRQPNVLIVFGGPHVPEKDHEFLQKHSFIDLACHGEGEQVALAILDRYESRDWSDVPSVSFVDENGCVVTNQKAGRVKELDQFPSPYLAGAFAPLMKANPSEHWIGLWETNRGCPFACTFCDWGSAIASKVYSFDIERLHKELEWFADHKIEFVFCCDANFGILKRDVDLASYAAQTKKQYGYPKALSVQATKNATERAYLTQKILADSGLNKGVDIALQSMDSNTLKSIKRGNISTETYQELQRRFTRDNVETFTDLILGLPGETYESFTNAVSTIVENGQHNRIQFNNLSILPNAEMGDPEYQKTYGMIIVETQLINIHGTLEESEDECCETQFLVVGTNSMPKNDWVRIRVFSWMAALLYFNKILQIPFVLIQKICSVSCRDLIEMFVGRAFNELPVLASVQQFFMDKSRDIQDGGAEFCLSEDWLNIYWPADEYILIKLCVENNLQQFYDEAEVVLEQYLREHSLSLPAGLLHETIEFNRSSMKFPFQTDDLSLELSHNVWEYYQSVLRGTQISLENRPTTYHIDRTSQIWTSWDDWCREVIWYGNKKGAYLYGNNAVEAQLSGHY